MARLAKSTETAASTPRDAGAGDIQVQRDGQGGCRSGRSPFANEVSANHLPSNLTSNFRTEPLRSGPTVGAVRSRGGVAMPFSRVLSSLVQHQSKRQRYGLRAKCFPSPLFLIAWISTFSLRALRKRKSKRHNDNHAQTFNPLSRDRWLCV